MKAKNFDTEKTLEQIAAIFAKYGYEGTSLDVIIKETGVGKQSLYNAYGDKKTMIAKALKCFGNKTESAQILKCTNLNGRQKIESFFETTLSECKGSGGCLVTNQLLETGGIDKDLQKAASQRWEQTRLIFQEIIEMGIKDKSITKSDAEITSYSIMNLLNGIRVSSRATVDKEKLKKSVKATLDSLL